MRLHPKTHLSGVTRICGPRRDVANNNQAQCQANLKNNTIKNLQNKTAIPEYILSLANKLAILVKFKRGF